MFTAQDLGQFKSKGIEQNAIEKQLENFRNGFPSVRLVRPATLGDGIYSFREDEISYYIDYYIQHLNRLRVIKFVPASGAASRMFKHLFEYQDSSRKAQLQHDSFDKEIDFNSVDYLISHIQEIAFFETLKSLLAKQGLHTESLIDSGRTDQLIGFILEEKGLNYANLPKGLILFHDYPEGARTAAEEHLVEAADYARSSDGTARIHFTISPEHRQRFEMLFERVQRLYESKFGVTFSISFSEQLPSTDTIAVDEENNPFRNPDGTLLFRPAGHGALLKNLGTLDADIIFIKNIDNIVPDRLKPTTYRYKKLIGGYLLYLREHINQFLTQASQESLSEQRINDMVQFIDDHISMDLPMEFNKLSLTEKQDTLSALLDRPIRVCGMVKNEGEPGGGPFWVNERDGTISPQIVESSQIDSKDPEQSAIFATSTHFNPLPLVCSIRNYMGKPFTLDEFVDTDAGIISLKSNEGKKLKAQELPGLWNGSMAHWITVFVETPIITFNPVKTINDLLRKEHLENKGSE